ncbi:hypothetical protein HDU67_010136 [Dinochytrium kinnereticum]|nr:hypothetical protein HDU67_010136 [Dinochytrium kinnereticum]
MNAQNIYRRNEPIRTARFLTWFANIMSANLVINLFYVTVSRISRGKVSVGPKEYIWACVADNMNLVRGSRLAFVVFNGCVAAWVLVIGSRSGKAVPGHLQMYLKVYLMASCSMTAVDFLFSPSALKLTIEVCIRAIFFFISYDVDEIVGKCL